MNRRGTRSEECVILVEDEFPIMVRAYILGTQACPFFKANT